MHALSGCYFFAGQRDKAISLCQQTIDLQRDILGLKNPETLASMESLTSYRMLERQFDIVLPLIEEYVELRNDLHGADHPQTLSALYKLGTAYCRAQKGEKAVPIYREYFAGQRRQGARATSMVASGRA